MSYLIKKSNGSNLVEVTDRSIEIDTTDLNLVGRGAVNYGQPFSENFVHLLENFANTTPPAKPISGQLWYDSGMKLIKVFTGTEWKSVVDQGIGIKPSDLKEMIKMIDGSGSGIDADLLDGYHSDSFVMHADIPTDFDWSMAGYAKLSGATFSGPVSVQNDTNTNIFLLGGSQNYGSRLCLSASPEHERSIEFRTNNLARWIIRSDVSAETGNDAGSNFRIYAMSDDASSSTISLYINRATSNIGLGTGAPASPLHIYRNGPASLRIENASKSVIATYQADDDNLVRIGSVTNHPVRLIKNSTVHLALDDETTFYKASSFKSSVDVAGKLTVGTAGADIYGTVQIIPESSNGADARLYIGNATTDGSAYTVISAKTGFGKHLVYKSGDYWRWSVYTDGDIEGGDDLGSNLVIRPYADDGAAKPALLVMKRNDKIYLGHANSTSWLNGTINAGDITAPSVTTTKIRLLGSGDLSATSTTHAFQVGYDQTENICIDRNEIMARSNGVVSALTLNNDGGDVYIGASSATARVRGNLAVGGDISANDVAFTGNVTSTAGKIVLSNRTAQSLTNGAVVLNAISGSIIFDSNGHKRISWNDGEGSFNLRGGCYYNGTNLVHVNDGASGNAASKYGAASITINTDSYDADAASHIRLIAAEPNKAGSVVQIANELRVTEAGVYINGYDIWHKGNFTFDNALVAYLGSGKYCYTSSQTTIVNSGQYVFNHGLGSVPAFVTAHLVFIAASAGYAIGDIIEVNFAPDPAGSNEGIGVMKTATSVIVRIGSNGPAVYMSKTDGGAPVISASAVKLVVRAYKY